MNEELTFDKGCEKAEEQYSGFEAVNANGVVLKDYANKDVVISGIATEYCVRNTVEEFLNSGHNIELLLSGLGYVDYKGHKKTIKELRDMVTIVE